MKREEIIGLDNVLDEVDKLIESGSFPHAMIIYGYYGSGRKTITKYIADKLGAKICFPDSVSATVAYTREIVEQATKVIEPTVFVIPNAHRLMYGDASNALLKIMEEPPTNAYFIITTVLHRMSLKAIASRSVRLNTRHHYTFEEMRKIVDLHGFADVKDKDLQKIVLENNTPGNVLTQLKLDKDGDDLGEFAEKVVNNIGTVSEANAYKIAEKVALKDTDTGFNLQAFWLAFCNICLQRAKVESNKTLYLTLVKRTTNYREKIYLDALSKQNLFDLWITDVKEICDEYM
jgi:DNA polymerase III delta prime subunit